MLQPRTVELQCAKQGAKRAPRAGFQVQRRPAVRAVRGRIEKGVDLLLEEVLLQGAEEVFGLRQGQPEMLDALMVLVEGDDIGDGLFLTLIVTHDKVQFDTHTGASPGSSDRGIAQAILPEFCSYPQHLPALQGQCPALSSVKSRRMASRPASLSRTARRAPEILHVRGRMSFLTKRVKPVTVARHRDEETAVATVPWLL